MPNGVQPRVPFAAHNEHGIFNPNAPSRDHSSDEDEVLDQKHLWREIEMRKRINRLVDDFNRLHLNAGPLSSNGILAQVMEFTVTPVRNWQGWAMAATAVTE